MQWPCLHNFAPPALSRILLGRDKQNLDTSRCGKCYQWSNPRTAGKRERLHDQSHGTEPFLFLLTRYEVYLPGISGSGIRSVVIHEVLNFEVNFFIIIKSIRIKDEITAIY